MHPAPYMVWLLPSFLRRDGESRTAPRGGIRGSAHGPLTGKVRPEAQRTTVVSMPASRKGLTKISQTKRTETPKRKIRERLGLLRDGKGLGRRTKLEPKPNAPRGYEWGGGRRVKRKKSG